MERIIVIIVFCSIWCKTSFSQDKKVIAQYKKYTYIIEPLTTRVGVNDGYAMAVKIKGWPYLLTCLHAFYKIDTPGRNFSNYQVASITGDITKKLFSNYGNNLKYSHIRDLEGKYNSNEVCTVVKVDLNRDLALLSIPKSMKLKKDDGVDFVDITSTISDTIPEASFSKDFYMIGVSRTGYNLRILALSQVDLSLIQPEDNLPIELVELCRETHVPNLDSFKCINVVGNILRSGFSGGPVFCGKTGRMTGVLWGGRSEYDNIAIIPKYEAFKDTLDKYEFEQLNKIFWLNVNNPSVYKSVKSQCVFNDKSFLDTLRWYFPYGVVSKHQAKDRELYGFKSAKDVILASVIYFNDYLFKSNWKTGNKRLAERVHSLDSRFGLDREKALNQEERKLMNLIHSQYPVTHALINLNGLFFNYNSNKRSSSDEEFCLALYNKIEELRDLVSNPTNITETESKAWLYLGFNIVDYLKRMTDYINDIKCGNGNKKSVSFDSECDEAIKSITIAKKNKTGLREAYVSACQKCVAKYYCDSSSSSNLTYEDGIDSSKIDCDSILDLAMRYTQPLLQSFYTNYGLDFKMPNLTLDVPRTIQRRDSTYLSFKFKAGKDAGNARVNALVQNYNVSQSSLDKQDKIFNVINDFIYGLSKVLSPILDTNGQQVLIVGSADGVRYDKQFKVNNDLGDLNDEIVYKLDEYNNVIDSVKFEKLISNNASSDDKNYALAFQRAYQFKLRLPNAILIYRIPLRSNIGSRISDEISGKHRSVELELIFKLINCKKNP